MFKSLFANITGLSNRVIEIYNNISNNSMDSNTYNNWVKIKETFEKSGNTSNQYYLRACEIVRTKKDPYDKLPLFGGKK
jgi:hypothetical protein